jgi:ribosome-associated protein
MKTFKITGEYIELCSLLKVADMASSGGEAKQFIADGHVKVNGEVEFRKRYKARPGDVVEFNGDSVKVE